MESLTCLCFKRNKNFQTPIGNFSYKYILKELYPIGLEYHQTEVGNFYMASPEKALCDMAYFQKIRNAEEATEYLTQDLRIDSEMLKNLQPSRLMELSKLYKRESVQVVVEEIIIQNGSS